MFLHSPLRVRTLTLLLLLPLGLSSQEKYETQTNLPEYLNPTLSPARTPEEALRSFELVEGFKIELVASEPMIEDPVLIDWDTKGRMWVAEMRGFMTDINATGQFKKIGRISVLEDTDADGRMDKVTRFLDDLVLPRALRCFQDGILVAEHEKLWYVTDTNNDLVPDERILIDPEYATYGSVEHRPNGLLIGLDNWIYNSRSNKRYRLENGEWITDRTENRGQWGITQDNYGRLYYNFHWSQLHADIAPPNALTRNPYFKPTLSVNATVSTDQFVYPIRMNTAINRGYRPGVLDDEGKLIRFASACSPLIYRGGLFPDHFNGDAFVCAPAANTIKRNLIIDKGLTVSGINAYPDRDFLASTDERFRPVSLSGGPDGALYLVDMYRGIIQQADFMTDYLRRESERRKLEKPINRGRIYRISPSALSETQLPHFHNLNTEQWVELLGHPNGWVRDKAQQWLIWKRPTGAADLLRSQATGDNILAAIHALWTLDGMGADPWQSCLDLLANPHPQLAATARRIGAKHSNSLSRIHHLSASLTKQGKEDPFRTFFTALAIGQLGDAANSPQLLEIAIHYSESPHIREAILSGLAGEKTQFLGKLIRSLSQHKESTGKKLLIQDLAACALRENDPITTQYLFQLATGSDWKIKAVAEGLLLALLERDKPISFPRDPGLNDPRFLPYLQWPGHQLAARQTAGATKLSSKSKELFVKGQAIYGSLCASCHGADGEGMTMLAPPLVNSEWVTGDPDRLARILLHGLEGSIDVNGKPYSSPNILPAMPPVGMMSNEEMAATVTYIRRAWGHISNPVSSGDIQRNRDLTADQKGAYRVGDLLKFSDH